MAKAKEMTVGDVRGDLMRDHKILIEKAMNKHNPLNDKPYFILVTADWQDGNIKTFAFVMPVRPPVDLISTILYKVNPISGKHEIVYCKPRDVPTGHVILDSKRTSVLDLIALNNRDSYTPIIH